jgi:hypothetical protein
MREDAGRTEGKYPFLIKKEAQLPLCASGHGYVIS